MKIEIEWLFDSHLCESCGEDYATGAVVKFDGEVRLTMRPVAGCINHTDYPDEDVYREIFAALGHELETSIGGFVR